MNGGLGLWAPVLVFVGAGTGAVLRWGLGVWWNAAPPGWPWGTLAANLLGGAMVGVAMATLDDPASWGLSPGLARQLKLLLVTGFLGGLTTFSTFSSEVIDCVVQGRHGAAFIWAGAHLVGSLALTGTGWMLARQLM